MVGFFKISNFTKFEIFSQYCKTTAESIIAASRATGWSGAAALRAMGATIEREDDGTWTIDGVGVGALLQPETALDMGNSGTSTRLLMGLVASHPVTATFTGDASLSKRPMGRVIDPLSQMGAQFTPSPGGRLPRHGGIFSAPPPRPRSPLEEPCAPSP